MVCCVSQNESVTLTAVNGETETPLPFLRLPNFDHLHRFLPALVMRGGGAVVSVPVHHRARERGTSKYGVHNRLWVGIVDLFGVAWLQRRVRLPIIEPDSDTE